MQGRIRSLAFKVLELTASTYIQKLFDLGLGGVFERFHSGSLG